jgi:hypothetical protein
MKCLSLSPGIFNSTYSSLSLGYIVDIRSGVTQLPTQWVPGIKRSKLEANHSPPFNAEVKKYEELYLYFPTCLYGVVLESVGNIIIYVQMENILTTSGNPICTKITFGLNL